MSNQDTIKELAAAKALFQQKTLVAVLSQQPVGSKPVQIPPAYRADTDDQGRWL